jgi:hypothetical protein
MGEVAKTQKQLWIVFSEYCYCYVFGLDERIYIFKYNDIRAIDRHSWFEGNILTSLFLIACCYISALWAKSLYSQECKSFYLKDQNEAKIRHCAITSCLNYVDSILVIEEIQQSDVLPKDLFFECDFANNLNRSSSDSVFCSLSRVQTIEKCVFSSNNHRTFNTGQTATHSTSFLIPMDLLCFHIANRFTI